MSDLRNKLALMTWGDEINISGYKVSFMRGSRFVVYGTKESGYGEVTKLFENTSLKQIKWYFEEILNVEYSG